MENPGLYILIGVVIAAAVLLVYLFFRGARGFLADAVTHATDTVPRNLVGVTEEAGNAVLRLTKSAADTLKDVLHIRPVITSERTVLFGRSKDILEVAVLSREITIEHEVSEKWLGLTKSVSAVAHFEVKIGYDLSEPLQLNVEGENEPTGMEVVLPQPQILSVEEHGVEFRQKEILWSRVNHKDRERLRMELNPLVRSRAMELELLSQAEDQMKQRLEAALRRISPAQIPIHFLAPPPPEPGWKINEL